MKNGKYLPSETFLIAMTLALAIGEHRQREQRLLCIIFGGIPDGAGFEPPVVIAVAGRTELRSCNALNRDCLVKKSTRRRRNGRILDLPRKADHRNGRCPRRRAHTFEYIGPLQR